MFSHHSTWQWRQKKNDPAAKNKRLHGLQVHPEDKMEPVDTWRQVSVIYYSPCSPCRNTHTGEIAKEAHRQMESGGGTCCRVYSTSRDTLISDHCKAESHDVLREERKYSCAIHQWWIGRSSETLIMALWRPGLGGWASITGAKPGLGALKLD